jgi:hypothetical protein
MIDTISMLKKPTMKTITPVVSGLPMTLLNAALVDA